MVDPFRRYPMTRLSVPGVAPADDTFAAPRKSGSRRPHGGAKVAEVRHLIEQTTLTYGEIARRTGVGRASICRWTRDGQWRRPPFAPRATDTVPRERASAQLRRRTLAARLDALAERHIRELEESPRVDADKLAEALELLKMAKLAARPRHRPRFRQPVRSHAECVEGRNPVEKDVRPRRPIMQLVMGDVDLHRAPRAAIEDFLANREPPPEEAGEPGRRGGRRESRRDRAHRLMLEKE